MHFVPALDVGGSLTAAGTAGSLVLTGAGDTFVLETAGVPVPTMFRFLVSKSARAGRIRRASVLLERTGVRLRVVRHGRAFLTLGPGCRGGYLSRLLGGAAVRWGRQASP
jgi:hypothetical protein